MIHLPNLLACATCMSGTGDGPSVAASWAIVTMLFFLGPVLFGFMGLIITLKRRETAALARESALGA